MRDKKSLEILQQIDYNFFKSEKAKSIPKPAAIGNQVFETDIKSVGIGIIHLSLPFLCILCVLCGLIIPIQPEWI